MNRVLLTSIFLFCVCKLFSQWQADFRLTSDFLDSYLADNNAHCIAAEGNVIHVVWYDNRDWDYEIYYDRSEDGGATWTGTVRLTSSAGRSEYPCIAISGATVHVAWMDDRDESYHPEIYYKRSLNGGISWEADQRLTSGPSEPGLPCLAPSGTNLHLVWHDLRDGNWEIYYKRSTDGGSSWGDDVRLTNAAGTSEKASVSVSGTAPAEKVSVAWNDDRDGDKEIYFKQSVDGGLSWQPDVRLTNSVGESEYACIASAGTDICVAWTDSRDGNAEIYCRNSGDSGLHWSDDIRITNNTGVSARPSVVISGSNIHLTWFDFRQGNTQIYYVHSTDLGTSWSSELKLSEGSSNAMNSSVAVAGTRVYVIWNDDRNFNSDIYFKQNPTGNQTTGLEDTSLKNPDLWYSPDPVSGNLVIHYLATETGPASLRIYDLQGKHCLDSRKEIQIPGENTWYLQPSKTAAGMYLVILETGLGRKVLKIIR